MGERKKKKETAIDLVGYKNNLMEVLKKRWKSSTENERKDEEETYRENLLKKDFKNICKKRK